jgi:FkbM family methyltransferase
MQIATFLSNSLRFLNRYWSAWHTPAAKALRHLRRCLRGFPRYQTGRVKVWGWDLQFVDAASCMSAFEIIVVRDWYNFKNTNPSPYILDCGSNIGISVLNFKRLFPDSEIVAFEPDPKICQTLRRNLEINHAANVSVVEAGLWDQAGEMIFESDGADGGRICASNNKEEKRPISTVRLVDYLHKPVDLLKLDIEGSETRVLMDSAPYLERINKIIIEYHVISKAVPNLSKLLSVLEDNGFRYYINSDGSWIDFYHLPKPINTWLDQCLMIFAQRSWE